MGHEACMLCLNSKLKLEAAKRNLETTMILDTVNEKNNANSVNALIENVKNSGKTLSYIEWSKEKGKEVKSKTYHSRKNALSDPGDVFAKKVRTDFDNLYERSLLFRFQYCQIAELKEVVKNSRSKMICIN